MESFSAPEARNIPLQLSFPEHRYLCQPGIANQLFS
jgi:hypothetical protein